MRPPLLAFLVSVLLALALAACAPQPPATTDYQPSAPEPVASPPASGPEPAAASPVPATSSDDLTPISERMITIAAVVRAVSAEDTVLQLDGQNEGVKQIRITPATRIVLESGEDGTFADLRAGQTVQAKGPPGRNGVLIARQVTVSRGY